MRSFYTQQAEAAQDLIMVLDSGRVTVIDRDGQLKRGDIESVSLKSQISVHLQYKWHWQFAGNFLKWHKGVADYINSTGPCMIGL